MTQCNEPVRGYNPKLPCLLDKGHKGHHSASASYCDGCGQYKRVSQIAYRDPDAGTFCWFCIHRERAWEHDSD